MDHAERAPSLLHHRINSCASSIAVTFSNKTTPAVKKKMKGAALLRRALGLRDDEISARHPPLRKRVSPSSHQAWAAKSVVAGALRRGRRLRILSSARGRAG
eukprot:1794288-Pleurochrysis_carterae.AAC.1